MKSFIFRVGYSVAAVTVISASVFALAAYASHSWGGYHWARTSNPFTVKLGDNVSTAWDASLLGASSDWSQSAVLDMVVVAGQTSPRSCRAVNGMVEVCNYRYGNNGWLGVASIWLNGSHITQGTVKLNDSYFFSTSRYNTPAWRNFVTCQEVGHTFGLDHQDEDFSNINLGTCMDYTSDPTGTAGTNGTLDNEHPNQHDYDELDAVYSHLDSFNSFSRLLANVSHALAKDADSNDSPEWGREVRHSSNGHGSVYEKDFGRGNSMVTFVIWANN